MALKVSKKPLNGKTEFFAHLDYYPKTENQKAFIDSMLKNTVSFGIGSPGSGKTHLAVVFALKALAQGDCKKIVLVRPCIEAGKSLGYLPGDLESKSGAHALALTEMMGDMVSPMVIEELMDENKIELAPLNYMRGRNFRNSIVIVDDAQNLDERQFYLMLTRFCEKTKLIITGDFVFQEDIRNGGLKDAVKRLAGLPGVGFTFFEPEDCQRSKLVKEIIHRYTD